MELDLPNDDSFILYIVYHSEGAFQQVKKYMYYRYLKFIRIDTTKYFEGAIFNYLNDHQDEWKNKDYVGILPYSFETKCYITLDTIYEIIINNLKNVNCDLIAFCGYDTIAKQLHGNIVAVLNLILPKVGYSLSIDYQQIPCFYCNDWMTRPKYMKQYIDLYLRVRDLFEQQEDKHLQDLLNASANVTSKLSPAELIKLFGFPHYPNHPYIMERLAPIFSISVVSES